MKMQSTFPACVGSSALSASRLSPWMMRLSSSAAFRPFPGRDFFASTTSSRNGTLRWWEWTNCFPLNSRVGMGGGRVGAGFGRRARLPPVARRILPARPKRRQAPFARLLPNSAVAVQNPEIPPRTPNRPVRNSARALPNRAIPPRNCVDEAQNRVRAVRNGPAAPRNPGTAVQNRITPLPEWEGGLPKWAPPLRRWGRNFWLATAWTEKVGTFAHEESDLGFYSSASPSAASLSSLYVAPEIISVRYRF